MVHNSFFSNLFVDHKELCVGTNRNSRIISSIFSTLNATFITLVPKDNKGRIHPLIDPYIYVMSSIKLSPTSFPIVSNHCYANSYLVRKTSMLREEKS